MSKLNVLLPLDSSEFSKSIADEVLHLFSPETHTLTFLRVNTNVSDVPEVARFEQAYLNEMNVAADFFAEKGYSTKAIVRSGNVVSEIVRYAEAEGIDQIAMATHGKSGLKRLREGSVAGEVLRSTYIPVTMVRPVARASKGAVTYSTAKYADPVVS